MQDIITSTSKNTPDALSYHHSKRHTLLYVVPLFVLLAGVSIWLYVHYKKENSVDGFHSLQLLEQASKPVTKSPDDQARDMNALEQSSSPTTTPAQQQDMLNALQ